MPLFYPSFSALNLASRLIEEIGQRTPGYKGRVGTAWYWQLPGGITVRVWLDNVVTEERWDVLRAEASTPRAGIFSVADFPFSTYATTPASPPFLHDLQGVAEWSNRLYFRTNKLIEDATLWIGMLHAMAISPQITPPSSFPALSPLERKLVQYAVEQLEGYFTIKDLYATFGEEISRARLSALSKAWEARELLTKRPRRVTYALQVLAMELASDEA